MAPLERLNCDQIMMRVAHLVALGINDARDAGLRELQMVDTVDTPLSVSALIGSDQHELGKLTTRSKRGPQHGS